VITPAPERRPTLRLPKTLPRERPLATPVSEARWGYFGSNAFFFRVGVLGLISFALLAILGLRIWSLEVIQGPQYKQLARRQTFRYIDLPTPRGGIVDSKGRVLVQSSGRLALTMDALRFGRTSRDGSWWQPSPRGKRALRRVAALLDVPVSRLLRNVRASVVRSPYAPAVVVHRLSQPLAFFLEERSSRLPSFHVTAFPDRQYPQGAFGSEFLGLLGQVTSTELRSPHYRGYKAGEVIGQSGVEARYDRLLNGGFGRARIPVDSMGQPIGNAVRVRSARTAHALRLTINAGLQRAAEQAIKDGIGFAHAAGYSDANGGAAVVMNPWTGAVYALAGVPDFNQVAAAHDPKYLANLFKGTIPGLLSLPTQGVFPLGSTFKPIVAEAALATGLITPWSTLDCPSSLTIGGTPFHNAESAAAGPLTLPQALSISCDTWFYQLGVMFDQRRVADGSLGMQRWAKLLGLGHPTGIDIPNEYSGVVPTPQWRRRTFKLAWQRGWWTGDSVNLSIGQGQLQVTPLQLAVAYSALANGGTVVTPHVGDALLAPSGAIARKLQYPAVRRLHLTDDWAIKEGLFDAAHQGTSAAIFSQFPIPVAGKTGTAQNGHGSEHSWYASWAPAGDPKVVVVVLIEHGGFGVDAAAPAAREIYQAYFGLDRKRKGG
jgi:penicillin-binding protein 2